MNRIEITIWIMEKRFTSVIWLIEHKEFMKEFEEYLKTLPKEVTDNAFVNDIGILCAAQRVAKILEEELKRTPTEEEILQRITSVGKKWDKRDRKSK
jgi:hypothetical protein